MIIIKIVLQRVSNASVSVKGEKVGVIGAGLLVLLGVGSEDTTADCLRLADKIVNLRIFSDENDKINLSLKDIDGEMLIVSQFTLYADCHKGNRPNFLNAGEPQLAEELYEYFIQVCTQKVRKVQHGIFGADMKVELLNDGPFTILLE